MCNHMWALWNLRAYPASPGEILPHLVLSFRDWYFGVVGNVGVGAWHITWLPRAASSSFLIGISPRLHSAQCQSIEEVARSCPGGIQGPARYCQGVAGIFVRLTAANDPRDDTKELRHRASAFRSG